MSALAPEIWAGAADTAPRRALQINHLSARARSETCLSQRSGIYRLTVLEIFFLPS